MFAFRKLCADKHFRQQLAALRHFKTKIPIDAFKGKQQGAEKKGVFFKKQADKSQTFFEKFEANFARKQGQDGYAYVALIASLTTITAGEIIRKIFPPNDRSAHTIVVENEPKTENTTDDKTLDEKMIDLWKWSNTPTTYPDRAKPDANFKSLIQSVLTDLGTDNNVPVSKFGGPENEELEVYFTDTFSIYGVVTNVPNVRATSSSLGLPFYAQYENLEDVNFDDLKAKFVKVHPLIESDLTIDLEELKGTSGSDIDELKETFVLSPDAKKFMIASHMIEWTSKSINICKSMKLLSVFSLFYVITATINEQALMFKRPFMLRLGVYMMMFSFVFMIALVTTEYCRSALDKTCDTLACKLGPNYAAGGVEYYQKAIKRIELLRKLLPSAEVLKNFDENSDLVDMTPPIGFHAKINDRLAACKSAQEQLDKNLPVESKHFITQLLLETIIIP